MGLSGSKKEEVRPKESLATAMPARKGRLMRRPFSSNIVVAERFLPEYFFVTETNSSLFVDEDGDTANEFYCESFDKHKRLAELVRKVDNLRPKGRVKYPIPRLHPDVPFVMWEVHQEH
ncbi:unnamed protein product [Toxocara canis]|uniref:PHM7_ext domain-containing protein n=1 Tax=Toxocara canis TaxID=6265 RepID=A0A183UGV0_TOXCA|nr:unnamed protein product [Toxocara canis]